MTKPDVEAWLSQMPLARPSSELEQRMSKLFAAAAQQSAVESPVVMGRKSVRQPWALMAVVAVVCLLMGVMAGQWMHRTVAPSIVQQRLSLPVGDNQQATMVQVDSAGLQQSDSLSNSEDVVRPPFWSEIQGPRVTMLCALRVGESGAQLASGVEQCLQCHSGLPDAESRFLQTHMLNPRFATCAWCHDHSRVSGPQ